MTLRLYPRSVCQCSCRPPVACWLRACPHTPNALGAGAAPGHAFRPPLRTNGATGPYDPPPPCRRSL